MSVSNTCQPPCDARRFAKRHLVQLYLRHFICVCIHLPTIAVTLGALQKQHLAMFTSLYLCLYPTPVYHPCDARRFAKQHLAMFTSLQLRLYPSSVNHPYDARRFAKQHLVYQCLCNFICVCIQHLSTSL